MRPTGLRLATCDHYRACLPARSNSLFWSSVVYPLRKLYACNKLDRRSQAGGPYKSPPVNRHLTLTDFAARHKLRSITSASMGKEDVEDYLRVAIQAARAAGQLIEQAFTQEKDVEFKGTMDLVTATDKECEQTILSAITTAFPEHKFIGEEGSAAQGFTSGLTDAPTW